MNVGINEYTLGIVTTNKDLKLSAGCPIFFAENNEQLQKKAMLMSKAVGGMVHLIEEGTLIIVKH